MTPDTAQFERNADMMVAEMDGDLVMMDVTNGSYFAINAVGGHIWEALETPTSMAGLVDSVHAAFASDDLDKIRADVDAFLADLAKHKLVREVHA